MDLIDMFSIFHHQTAEYIFFFFSSAYETLSGMDHILGHKSSLAKFKKLKSEQAIFSDHTDTWLGIIYRKICKKHKHMEKSNRSLKKSKRKFKNT